MLDFETKERSTVVIIAEERAALSPPFILRFFSQLDSRTTKWRNSQRKRMLLDLTLNFLIICRIPEHFSDFQPPIHPSGPWGSLEIFPSIGRDLRASVPRRIRRLQGKNESFYDSSLCSSSVSFSNFVIKFCSLKCRFWRRWEAFPKCKISRRNWKIE